MPFKSAIRAKKKLVKAHASLKEVAVKEVAAKSSAHKAVIEKYTI